MNTYADKTQENKSQSVSAASSQRQSGSKSSFQFVDNRSEVIAQRKLQEMMNNSVQVNQATQLKAMPDGCSAQQAQPIQKKENNTGLPDNLKRGIENLSGYSMDDVKVHYNSNKPAQLQAHAYAQGTDIHLASGQERHLPHEAWHVVQQKQGRVKPTLRLKGDVHVNDDTGLEKEADVMGAKVLQLKPNRNAASSYRRESWSVANSVAQKKSNGKQSFGFVDNRPGAITQRKLEALVTGNDNKNIAEHNKSEVKEKAIQLRKCVIQLGVNKKSRDRRKDDTHRKVRRHSKLDYYSRGKKSYRHKLMAPEDLGVDRKGNQRKDTIFEAAVAHIISKDKTLYNLHKVASQKIAGQKKLKDDDSSRRKKGTLRKFYMEKEFSPAKKEEYEESLAYYRQDYLENTGRGRKETELWKKDCPTAGNMTPTTSPKNEKVGPLFTGGAGRRFVAPKFYELNELDNKAEKRRRSLGLPFGAGPSGTMVYALSMFHDQRDNEMPRKRLLAISLAAYLVRHGHHSFFEALAPLNLSANSKREYYLRIVEELTFGGYRRTARQIRLLIYRFYPSESVNIF